MKSKPPASPPRKYRQTSRARAAEATGRRIVDCFLGRLESQWFEDVTLDAIAADSGVTVQTILRRFGSKAGLLEAAHRHLGETVAIRRSVDRGDVERSVSALARDYEAVGDLVLRLLAQEERHPDLKPILDRGRAGHRDWLAAVFADHLDPLPPARRAATLDALVVATDLHVWKVVRREMGRPVSAFKTIVKNLLRGILRDIAAPEPDPAKRTPRERK